MAKTDERMTPERSRRIKNLGSPSAKAWWELIEELEAAWNERDEARAAIQRVRELHSKFPIYGECDCDIPWSLEHPQWMTEKGAAGTLEYHQGKEPVYFDEVGFTCEEPQYVCHNCDTIDGETHEYTENGVWPCATIKALDLP